MIIIDKMPSFSRSVDSIMEDALREGGRDVLIKAKTKAPFQKGGLRSESDVSSQGKLKQRISFWKEYARFQEFGGDGKRRIRKYSSSGTGAHFLKDSGDEQAQKMNMIFKKHGLRARP